MATFSDTQLIQIVIKAARRINRKLKLTGTTNEIVVNSVNGEIISPDNDDLDDLVLLQAECMIVSRQFSEELSDGTGGLLVKDGEQILDTKSAVVARGTFFDSPNSPCSELVDAIKLYKFDNFFGRLVW